MLGIKTATFTTPLLLSASLAALSALPARAQVSQAGQTSNQGKALEEIVVVGSSIKVSQSEVERGATPIQLLAGTALDLAGQRSVGDLLRTQPTFTGTSQSADGVGVGRQTLNLRGLGDQYTLSLINGRRFAVNGAANVGIIPLNAIERVEVLTAGASSIYGSDAVAGVVNIALKRDADGSGADFNYGSGKGGLQEREYSAYSGSRSEDGGFIIVFDRFERDGLLAADLPDGTNNLTAFGAFDFRSSFTSPPRITLPNGSDVILNAARFAPGTYSNNPADYRPFDFNRDSYDRQQGGIWAMSPTTRTSLLVSGHRAVSGDTRITFDLLANRTNDQHIYGSSVTPISVPATNPYNPFGTEVISNYRFSDYAPGPYNKGIGNIVDYKIDTISTSLALEHDLSNRVQVKATVNYFREESNQTLPNAYSMQGFIDALNRTGPDAYNAFCSRCNTAAQLSGVLVGAYDNQTSQLYDFDGRITGRLATLPAGDINIAAGAGYRREELKVDPSSLYAQGGLVDQGTVIAQSLPRSVAAVFAEVKVPVLTSLEAQGAARYEHYSDFGGTFNPLVALRWEALPGNLAFRASYTTSFRAPFLQDLTSQRNSSQILVIDPLTNVATPAAAVTGGNPNLRPEKARTFSVGIIATPEVLHGFTATLDFSTVKQSNIVISPSPQAVISGLAPGSVFRGFNVGGAGRNILIEAFEANGGSRLVNTLDFKANYQLKLASRTALTFDLSGTRVFKFAVDQRDGSGAVNQAGTYSALFGGLPKEKGNFSVILDHGPLTLNGKLRYIGAYTDPSIFGTTVRTVGAVGYFDFAARFDLVKAGFTKLSGAELILGIDNVTNRLPPFARSAILFSNDNAPWDRGNHDIGGRIFHAGLGAKF